MLRNTVPSVYREGTWLDSIFIWQMPYDLLFGDYQIRWTEMFMTTPGINPAACFGSRTFKKKKKGKM